MSIFACLFLLIGLGSGALLGGVAGLLWRNSVGLERHLRPENNAAGPRVREKARTVESYFVNRAPSVELQRRRALRPGALHQLHLLRAPLGRGRSGAACRRCRVQAVPRAGSAACRLRRLSGAPCLKYLVMRSSSRVTLASRNQRSDASRGTN